MTRSASDRAGGERAGLEPTSWSPKVPGVWQVGLDVGEMLDERAAACDVEQLHPAADAQHRHVALERPPGEGELEPVALGPDPDRLAGAATAP